jgi:hypothetical protein
VAAASACPALRLALASPWYIQAVNSAYGANAHSRSPRRFSRSRCCYGSRGSLLPR